MAQPTQYLTTKEAADLIGCSQDLVHNDCLMGRLTPDAVTGRVKGFLAATLRRWWRSRDVRVGHPGAA